MDRFRFNERCSGSIAGDIVDTNGDEVPAASLTGATLTLYDAEFGSLGSPASGIINGRLAQNVLNANDVTIDSDGHFEWSVQSADNGKPDGLTEKQEAMLNCRQIWRHRAMFLFTWAGGEFRFEVELEVVNLRMAG